MAGGVDAINPRGSGAEPLKQHYISIGHRFTNPCRVPNRLTAPFKPGVRDTKTPLGLFKTGRHVILAC
jgi:hypothetical protein